MNIIKSPQDNIEAYLYNEINIELYKENIFEEPERLIFFNLLFQEFEFFCENKHNYLIIENHFKIRNDYDLEMSSDVLEVIDRYYHYEFLVRLLDDKYPIEKRASVLIKTCEHIEDVCKKVSGFFRILVGSERTFDAFLKSISDLDNGEKINTLIDNKYTYLRIPNLPFERSKIPFNELCDMEIQKIKELIENETVKSNEPEAIDLSDTKAIDKILYLQKLGVIDFLRGQQPFNTSVNSLASVLTAITGEKTGTLQPMLNPMLSKKVDDKNNPLNSKIAVSRVEKQLIKIGFNLNETN